MQNRAVMGLRIEFLRIGIIKGMYLVLKTTRTYRGPEKCVSDLEMETRAGEREREPEAWLLSLKGAHICQESFHSLFRTIPYWPNRTRVAFSFCKRDRKHLLGNVSYWNVNM